MNDSISVALTGTTHTLVQADALANIFFLFTGALGGANTITLPANKRIYLVVNNTTGGFNLIFKAGTGATTVTVTDTGVPHFLYCDGVNTVYEVGSPVSAGALQHPVNAQTGTSYTVLNGDRGKLLTIDNASPVAVTLPQAGAASAFLAGWFVFVQNKNAGVVTITPTTSTINGAATLVLQKNGHVLIVSDGANYQVFGVLPNPSTTTLGGMKSKAAVATQFLTELGTDGTPLAAQPAVTDLSGYVVANATAQTANIGATTLVTPGASGSFRVAGYIVVTTVAGTSSTLPSIVITWTDPDNNTAQSLTLTPTDAGNILTTLRQATAIISAKTGVAVQYATTGYASDPAATMQYAIRLVLEKLS